MKNTVFLLFALAAVAGCAQSPSAIAPVSMGDAYQNISCSKARTLLSQEESNLSALSQQQANAQVGDAIGVFFLLVPMSSVTGGDKAGEIAASKGKIDALKARLLTCG